MPRNQRKAGPKSRRSRSTTGAAASEEGNRDTTGIHVKAPGPDDADAWHSLRQGARNVAGVRFQVAVTAHLLASGRAGVLPLIQFTPEGLEDIDCVDTEGASVLVQVKEVGAGAGTLTAVNVADVLAHAALVNGAPAVALVTDGDLGSGLRFTDWDGTLAEQGGQPFDDVVNHLVKRGHSRDEARSIASTARLVRLPWNLRPCTEQIVQEALGAHPAVASLALSRLYETLTASAAAQRSTTPASAISHRLGDLDTIVNEVQSIVDVSGLETAVAAGVCAPADYLSPSDLEPAQFYAGVDGAPGHVAAHLDVIRPHEMAEIVEAMGHERYALLIGPSGSGKSMLLWRSARDAVLGSRVLRVRKVATRDDVELLLRHVRLLGPSAVTPVIVAADHLGRPSMQEWPLAIDALRELPAVFLIGAVRAEDFTPRILRGGARVIEPRLDHETASRIAQSIREASVEIRIAPLEAELRAEGLLMEFIALLTTGQRLEQVLAEQLEALRQPGRELQRTLARLVTAAHTAGVAIPTAALEVSSLGSADAVGDALHTLRGEHVVTTDEGSWRGLHELRSETITRLLHESPPPTLGQTYAEVVRLLPANAAAWLLRRAAEEAGAEVSAVASAISPLLGTMSAAEAAMILEGAERADNALYAHACLPILRTGVRPGVGVEQVALFVYPMRHQGFGRERSEFAPLEATFRAMRRLADQLPDRESTILSSVAGELDSDRLVALTDGASLEDTVRLLEAVSEGVLLSVEAAGVIYQRLNEPTDADAADMYARLIAAIATVGRLTTEQLKHVFGSPATRAALVTQADPNATSVAIDDTGNCVTATIMHSTSSGAPAAAPTWDLRRLASGDGANDAAVRTARRLADACPEASVFEVITISPSGARLHIADREWAYKRMEKHSFPRRLDVRRSVGFQAAVSRLIAATSWTQLVKNQVAVAQDLLDLVRNAPSRLSPHDNAARRRQWAELVETTRSRASELAGPPTKSVLDPAATGASADDEDRRSDLTSDALHDLANALPRLVSDTHYGSVASALGEAKKKMAAARLASNPRFVGIGRPLPDELTESVQVLIDLLVVAYRDPSFLRKFRPADLRVGNREALDDFIETEKARERARVEEVVGGVMNAEVHEVGDPQSFTTNLGGHAWLVTVPLASWEALVKALDDFSAEKQAMSSNVLALSVEQGTALPLAIRLTHVGDRRHLPMTPDMIQPFADQLGLEVPGDPVVSLVPYIADALVERSRRLALGKKRDASWSPIPQPPIPSLAELRDVVASETHAYSGGEASALREALNTLIEQVQAEVDGTAVGSLAGEVVDGQGFGPPDDTALPIVWEAITIATISSSLLSLPSRHGRVGLDLS